VIYDEVKKRHENFVMDQRISCSDGGGIQLRGKTGQGGAVARMRSSGSCKVRKGDNMIVCVCMRPRVKAPIGTATRWK
jgi:hypothetical protein